MTCSIVADKQDCACRLSNKPGKTGTWVARIVCELCPNKCVRADWRKSNYGYHDEEESNDMQDQYHGFESWEQSNQHSVDEEGECQHCEQNESGLPALWFIRRIVEYEQALDDSSSEIGSG